MLNGLLGRDKMRLAVFMTWDVSLELWETKGLLQREMRLYEKLTAQGIDITFITWGRAKDLEIAGKYPFIKVVPAYTQLPYLKLKFLRFVLSLFAPFFLKNVLRSAQVLKTNQMWGAWVAVIAKYIFKKKLIVRTGFELYDFTLRGGYSRLRQAFIYIVSWICYRAADKIFLATEGDARFVEEKFSISAEKIEICPNWIDISLFSPDDVIQKNGRALFIGRLNAQKNLPALIAAAAQKKIALDIIGTGELEETLKNLAKEKRANVAFHGPVANDKLPAFYQSCSLYVLPSFYEGNPKTLLEAMACGAAVVGANTAGISDIIDHKVNGYLCEPDEDSLANALSVVMDDSSLQKAMGKAARDKILAHNTLDAQAEREVHSLRELSSI